jgi:PAS domain S-box-containing protein
VSDPKKSVLVVDDAPEEIIILTEILKREYQVRAVTNGAAALALARSGNPPDLILLDIMMPEMDGFEVCRNLKMDSKGATIPIIFLTAKLTGNDEKEAFELGATDYIRKPVDPELVLARVKAHMEQKEELVRISEVRYRRLFETSPDGIMIIDKGTGKVVDINPAMTTLLGMSQESFLDKKLADLEVLKDIADPQGRLSILRRSDSVRYSRLPLATVDGRNIFVEATCNPYIVNQRELVQLNLRDVTELTLAEQARDELSARLSHYLSTSPTITYSLRLEKGVALYDWVSDNITRILGYSPKEAMEPEWWFKNLFPEDRTRALDALNELIKHKQYAHEYRFLRKDRSVLWIRDDMRLIQTADGKLEIVGTHTDVTERKGHEELIRQKSVALEQSLAERNVLLREVHHRVKNNMQVISSLLSLSAGSLPDPTFRKTIDAVIRRIGAMSVAHEQFYESDDIAHIDFSLYLRELATALVTGTGGTGHAPLLNYEADSIMLSLEDAIPAGLIVSELVSNALRHAFVDLDRQGTVLVSLRHEAAEVVITIADDGIGLPAGCNPALASSLGLKLVYILSDQVNGHITFAKWSGKGTLAELRFKPYADF